MSEIRKSADISECGVYRYSLTRSWAGGLDRAPWLLWVMLNPSTADAEVDDPTIRRCVGYADDLRYGGIVVVNLFAFRATDPRELRTAVSPVGPRNDEAICHWAGRASGIVCAWGAHGGLYGRDEKVVRILREVGRVDLQQLGACANGKPSHPLRLSRSLAPQPLTGYR